VSKRIELLRLDYLFSVIVPLLLAIYLNALPIAPFLPIIAGFGFYAITGNTLNDVIDMRDPHEVETLERVAGYHWKEIATIAVIGFVFGSMMFVKTVRDHPVNGLLLVLIVAMVVLYCVKKNIPVLNQILLGVSHVVLPYAMIKIDAGIAPVFNQTEVFALFCFFAFAFSGQIVHEIIDGDSITRFSPRTQQLVVIVSSVIAILLAVVAVVLLDNLYIMPFALIPFGSIYTFRRPTRSTRGVKDVGIVLGNVIMAYLIILIVADVGSLPVFG
jgi:hypothetical protein